MENLPEPEKVSVRWLLLDLEQLNLAATTFTSPPTSPTLIAATRLCSVRSFHFSNQNEEYHPSSHCGLRCAYCCTESFFPSSVRRECFLQELAFILLRK